MKDDKVIVINADVLVSPRSTKRYKASIQALGRLMSGWEDRLHGEERFRGIAPGTGIMSCYACRDRIEAVDSSKGTLVCHESSRHDAVCCGGEGG
jgi:hypothetical protein